LLLEENLKLGGSNLSEGRDEGGVDSSDGETVNTDTNIVTVIKQHSGAVQVERFVQNFGRLREPSSLVGNLKCTSNDLDAWLHRVKGAVLSWFTVGVVCGVLAHEPVQSEVSSLRLHMRFLDKDSGGHSL